MSATIYDVANKAGVSISTVSRAFTHPARVSDKTREEVTKVAKQLNFWLFAVWCGWAGRVEVAGG
ncbi:hypothetical protein BPY_22580 [Bifidobacterium psychraerophilum]|uniref:LacI family DNA-binding transcriptional regulator n=1 Tax=Bifidobacterium psychraerophilum TaxID=218140 RepID=UPI00310E72EC